MSEYVRLIVSSSVCRVVFKFVRLCMSMWIGPVVNAPPLQTGVNSSSGLVPNDSCLSKINT